MKKGGSMNKKWKKVVLTFGVFCVMTMIAIFACADSSTVCTTAVDTTTNAVATVGKGGVIQWIWGVIAAFLAFCSLWLPKIQALLKKISGYVGTISEGLKLATTTTTELEELVALMTKASADQQITNDEAQAILKEFQDSKKAITDFVTFLKNLKALQSLTGTK
jgi:hypothetical protein